MHSNGARHEPITSTLLISHNELQHHQLGRPEEYFFISPERLAEIVEVNMHTESLQLCGIFSALRTNLDTGIIGDQRDLHFRTKVFGSNLITLSCDIAQSLKQLLLDACKDMAIFLLLCCAVISLAIGIKRNGMEEGLTDGAFIFLNISIVISFGAIFRFFQGRWMIKKSLKQHKKVLLVVRNGKMQKITESQVVVGDIVYLKTGDEVPADGIFIDGYSFQPNEGVGEMGSILSPYHSLFTGAKVVKGHCRMLVTSVGENTERSRLIRSIALIRQNDHQRPKAQLLDAIEKTNSKLENILLSLTLILLILQLVRCFVWRQDHKTDDRDHNLDSNGVKGTFEDLMDESIKLMKKETSSQTKGLVTMLCVLLFARRDGLPLAIFTSLLLYAAKKMKSRGAIIQKLPASATIGLVTTICLDGKTADLVLQHANMADWWVGTSLVDQNVLRQVDNQILDILREGIFVHTGHNGQADISLLSWARPVLGLNIDHHEFHRNHSIIRHEAPDMDKSFVSCLVMKHNSSASDKGLHVHWKGDPQLIVFMCSRYYTVDGTIETLDDNKRSEFLQIVDGLVSCGRRCFAFAYKQETQEEENSRTEEKEREEVGHNYAGVETLKPSEDGLILLALVGLKNPYTPETIEAIEDCRKSGIGVKLLVDDDINTARIIALNCGILRPEDDISESGAVVDASDFRTSSEEDRMNMIDNIHVMANSSPADKLLMVQCLRQKGERVAATVSCIRDCPLMKQADVGIFTGDDDHCPQVCKEDGDILVLSRNFSQIPGIIRLGKQVCGNLEKIVNLQLTLGISAFTVNFIGAAALDREELISSFQLLWTNLIMGVLGTLATAIGTVHTHYSSERNKSRPKVYGSGPVITRSMYRNIALQSVSQITVILILGTKGKACFQVSESALETMIFNCYAFCQVFMLICSNIDLKKTDILGREKSSSAGKNCLFLGCLVTIGILQVAVSEMMGVMGHWATLDIKQWCICIGTASFSVPLNIAANGCAFIVRKSCFNCNLF
ncbi:calcium-transporting ATPase 12, plasma membrane-type-like [Sesamum indicum]|uniref:Calcium-transporting ATPase 12, plasma membrane-type-like n=1 Tax=Sesamum indicum TaxID=4182 RepID=A0A6I9UD33_SESIN|nr:calcium-transporting ATPase 12, plasma membrane-type-like [Sesamum indicum]